MKTIVKIFAAVLLTLSLSACSDFLKERQTTTYDGAALVNSTGALESAVLGVHRQFALSGFKTGAFCEWLAPASGLAIWGNTNALVNPMQRWTCCHNFTRYAKHPEAYDSFKSFYKTIYLANHLLEAMEKSPVKENNKPYWDEIQGEVYFLRAVSYFYLVRLYGDVSLYLDAPGASNEIKYQERENFWVVYCQIIEDLNKAQAQMRDFKRMCTVSANVAVGTGGNASGRVCDYAATAFRSLVYLTVGTLLQAEENQPGDNFWTSDRTPAMKAAFEERLGISESGQFFQRALEDAKKVLPVAHGGVPGENGELTPFALEEVYGDLFRWSEPEDWQSLERIFALPRAPESNDAGSALTMWALPCYYNDTDKVENFGRCRPDRWFFQTWCERYGGIKSPNPNVYTGCEDPRMAVNLVYGSYLGRNGEGKRMNLNCYPTDERIKPGSDDGMKRYGMPYYKKYYDPTFNNSVGNADFYVMRLAEVYLIAAEASAHLGRLDESVGYVNHLLARARRFRNADGSVNQNTGGEPKDWVVGSFTKETLLRAIFWERCFEMPFEHHEYFDTHRYGAQWIVDNICIPKNDFLAEDEQADYTNEKGAAVKGYRSLYYGDDFQYKTTAEEVRRGLINSYPYDELVYNTELDETLEDPLRGQNPSDVCWEWHAK